MSNQVTGKIIKISKVESMQSKSGSTFTKQSVYLDNGRFDPDTGEHYENNLLLDFINLRDGDISQRFKQGDKVTISFRLRGRSFDNKEGKKVFATDVSCFRIEPFQSQSNTQQVAQQPAQANTFPQSPQPANNGNQGAGGGTDSDLPF